MLQKTRKFLSFFFRIMGHKTNKTRINRYKRSKSISIMKNIKLFIAVWLVLFSLLTALSSSAQTDNYSCNVICINQPDHVMTGVKVDLYNTNNEFIATTYTDDQGYFNFDELNIGESYIAKFSYDAENPYVDLEDAFAILSYLAGLTEFDENQILAADVDGSGNILWTDFTNVLINFYLQLDEFPIGNWILPDWHFTLDGDKATGGPAGAISTGNVADDDEPDKSVYYVQADYNEVQSFSGLNTIKVPVYLNQNEEISGFALIADYDDELFEVVDIESPLKDLEYHVNKNEIRLAWTSLERYVNNTNQAIAYVHLRQISFSENEIIEKLEILNESHVLDSKGSKIPYIGFTSNEFKTAALPKTNAIAYPNPCKDFFYIQVDDVVENAEIILYNALGQIVEQRTVNIDQQIEISTAGMKKGIYYYHINYQSKSITGPISIR